MWLDGTAVFCVFVFLVANGLVAYGLPGRFPAERWPDASGPNPAAGGEGIVKGMSESAGACNSTLTLEQICSTYAG